jgi:hypothetical protein
MAFNQASISFSILSKKRPSMVGDERLHSSFTGPILPEIMPSIREPFGPNGPKSDTVAGLSIPELAGQNLAYTEEIAKLKSRVRELRMNQSFGAPPPKFFLVSKGFLGGLWAVLFGLGVTCAEAVGVTAWDAEHWYQLIKVFGAAAGTLAAGYGLYGRVVANAPLKFWLED